MLNPKHFLDHKHYPGIMFVLTLSVLLLLFFNIVSIFDDVNNNVTDSKMFTITGQVIEDTESEQTKSIMSYSIFFLIQLSLISTIIFIGYLALKPLTNSIFKKDEYSHFSKSSRDKFKDYVSPYEVRFH